MTVTGPRGLALVGWAEELGDLGTLVLLFDLLAATMAQEEEDAGDDGGKANQSNNNANRDTDRIGAGTGTVRGMILRCIRIRGRGYDSYEYGVVGRHACRD